MVLMDKEVIAIAVSWDTFIVLSGAGKFCSRFIDTLPAWQVLDLP